jgi:hypothetical protein
MDDRDSSFIAEAAQYLEKPSFVVRIADKLGKPLEAGLKVLPEPARRTVQKATHAALERALDTAIATGTAGAPRAHTGLTALTGFAGGFFGLAGLAVELPITTCVMLRSVASIAAINGFDVKDPGIKLECLLVFALGGPSKDDDDMESAYFSARLGTAKLLDEAAKWLLQGGARETAPALVQLLARVAARFEIVVGEKALAEMLPLLGAFSGAAINAAFTEHFNAVARYHFGLRALERKHGVGRVRELYENARRGRDERELGKK